MMAEKNNTVTVDKGHLSGFEDIIVKISQRNEEPPCIKDFRLEKWKNYVGEPLPDKVLHLWRYCDPASFDLANRVLSEEGMNIDFQVEDNAVSQGLILTELKNSFKLEGFREKIKNTFGGLISLVKNKFTYLNEATWSSGYFLYVPMGLKVDKPISVKLRSSGSNALKTVRLLLILEENSSINLIAEASSKDSDNLLTNVVSEVYLAKGAKLNYLSFQAYSKDTVNHSVQVAKLEDKAELTNLIVALGGKNSKVEMAGILNGKDASISTFGIVLGDQSQRFDHHTSVEHNAPHTKSTVNFRVALKDKARSAYTGNLKIANHAVKSDAIQENRNLLLSKTAKAESIPELEILTNDVIRCSHGVTIGNVDKEQIYYLMSRGLSEKEAEWIIISGFLEPTISRVPDENLRVEIEKIVNHKLGNL